MIVALTQPINTASIYETLQENLERLPSGILLSILSVQLWRVRMLVINNIPTHPVIS